ncbi:HYR domain-containing protein [Christiangramia aquimixticola]|uniref:HYR domain-containing protein n=1 Tax=Christiangramia aquimixticola TaxID=1697558 RepID=UPI003AA7D4DD
MRLISAAYIFFHKTSTLLRLYACLIIFLCAGQNFAQNPATTVPTYKWEDAFSMPSVTVASLNSEDINIAVATGPSNYLYILTFGNGVQRRDPDGGNVRNNFISGLKSPLDIAVDDDGLIYVADFFAGGDTYKDNGQIKVYDQDGNYLRSVLTSYFRPMGIDVDDQYLYIAEHNDGKKGPESTPSSRIRIVDKVTGDVKAVNNNITIPYRIAVSDITKKVYVSQAGNGTGSVEIYDQNLSSKGKLPNIDSPGSVVIDQFGFIHVIEYSNRVNFEEFIRLSTDFDLGDLLQLSHDIRDGVEDDAFYIKLFNSQEVPKPSITEKIDFPIDLTFNLCDKMYVDNSKIFGTHIQNFLTHSFFPSRLEFEVEIYNRTPAFDLTPPVIACTSNITVQADEGQSSKAVTYALPAATDLCGMNLQRTAGLASGSQFPVGTNTVEYTATDNFGNSASCSFLIIVEAAEVDTPPKFDNCPSNITKNNDPGQCGAIVTFATPTVTDDSGAITPTRTDTSGLNSGDLFPVGETIISYEANDGVNDPVTCSFKIIVTDNEKPVVTNCPGNINESVAFEEDGKIITYTPPGFTDNCPAGSIIQTAGKASGEKFPVGTTTNTFEVNDGNGNIASCSFDVIITREEEDTPPKFDNCPSNISHNNDPGQCGAIVTFDTPTVSDDSGAITPTRTDTSGLNSGDLFPVGETVISYEANDGVNDPVTCSFKIIVTDNEKPVIENCPQDPVTIKLKEGETYEIPDYSESLQYSDNCDPSPDYSQSPAAGTKIENSTTVNIQVTDDNAQTSSCSFNIIVEQVEDFSINCVDNFSVVLDAGSGNTLVSVEDLVLGDISGIEFEISEYSFSCTDIGQKEITINATKTETGEKASCTATLNIVDNTKPVINCYSEAIEASIPANGSYTLGELIDESRLSDNCTSVENISISQSPVAGTEYTEEGTYQIRVTATDASGNKETCDVILKLTKEQEPTFDCPAETDFEALQRDVNCMVVIPDYRDRIKNIQNVENPVIEQTEVQSVNTVSVTLQILEGEGGEIVGECKFEVEIRDSIAPEIFNCEAQAEKVFINEGTTYTLPNYISELEISDNCDPSLNIIQQPAEGTEITESTIVEILVSDDSGNETSCEILIEVEVVPEDILMIDCPEEIIINPNDNCEYLMPDLSDAVNVSIAEAELSQNISANTIIDSGISSVRVTATYEGQTQSCDINIVLMDTEAPEINCPADIITPLPASGEYTITDYTSNIASDNCPGVVVTQAPNAGTIITDDTTIYLEATDAAGNISTCDFSIIIVKDDELEIACPEDKLEQFNSNCEFVLPDYREEAVLLNGEGAQIKQTPAPGTIIDLAEVEVTLSVTSGDQSDSCTFQVSIRDNTPPTILVTGMDIELDSSGRATLTFEDIDIGSYDNCGGEVVYSLNRSDFTCKYLGENTIVITAIDVAGNTNTANVEINVTAGPGICSGVVPESDYIFVYPNPNTGNFKVATPAEITIYRIEVFDHRGRFITAKNYGPEIRDYAMDLQPMQEAVYVLKLYTSEGLETERIIFKY